MVKTFKPFKLFRRLQKGAFFRALVFVVVSAVVTAWAIYHLEGGRNEQFKSVWDGVWWFFVTIPTVGYGDKVPGSPLGRVLAVGMMFLGVAVLSVITATISSIFVAQKLKEGKGLQEVKLKDHLLLCGWNRNCEDILNILVKQKHGFKGIVLINQLPEDTIVDLLARFENYNVRFVRGDYTKENVLMRAAVKTAQAAIVVPDESSSLNKRGDEASILATLSLKTLNPKIRVIVHIQDEENYTHLSKAKADEIVVSDAYTSHLLANYVVAPGVPQFLEKIFADDSDVRLRQYPIPSSLVGATFDRLKTYCAQKHPGGILLGLGELKEAFDISSLMSSDYSYLDEFIMRKFQQAGLGKKDDKRVNIQLAPEESTVLTKSQFYLILERNAHE